MKHIVTISSKRQFTIPKSIRVKLGFKPGALVAWSVRKDGTVAVRPLGPVRADHATSATPRGRKEASRA
jgi:AbrB family looped-hinge helix DNA binding protein